MKKSCVDVFNPVETRQKVYDADQNSSDLRPWFDSHLVLNGLNRVAAVFYSRTGIECDDLYAVSDYLNLAMRLGKESLVSFEEEAGLLNKYLTLVNACNNNIIIININVHAASRHQPTFPHLTCEVAVRLLHAFKSLKCKSCSINVNFDTAGIIFKINPGGKSSTEKSFSELLAKDLKEIDDFLRTSFNLRTMHHINGDHESRSELIFSIYQPTSS